MKIDENQRPVQGKTFQNIDPPQKGVTFGRYWDYIHRERVLSIPEERQQVLYPGLFKVLLNDSPVDGREVWSEKQGPPWKQGMGYKTS